MSAHQARCWKAKESGGLGTGKLLCLPIGSGAECPGRRQGKCQEISKELAATLSEWNQLWDISLSVLIY